MRSQLLWFTFTLGICPSLSAQEPLKLLTRLEPRQPAFSGEWRPKDPEETGMDALWIADTSGNWSIHPWGRCMPTACDWGERRLTLLSTNPLSANFERGFATWDHGFATSYMILRMEGDVLMAEIYTLFKDESHRSPYFHLVPYVRATSAGQH